MSADMPPPQSAHDESPGQLEQLGQDSVEPPLSVTSSPSTDGQESPLTGAGDAGAVMGASPSGAAVRDVAMADAAGTVAGGQPEIPGSRARLLVSRRKVLIAGGGVVLVGGGLLLARDLGLLDGIGQSLRGAPIDQREAQRLPAAQPRTLPDGPMSTPRDLVIYDSGLTNEWDNMSWGTYTLVDRTMSRNGKPSISLDLAEFAGLRFQHDAFDTSGFAYVQCFVRAGGADGLRARLYFLDESDDPIGNAELGNYTQGGRITRGQWRLARVPLSDLQATSTYVQAIIIQSLTDQRQGTLYVADLRLVYSPDLRPPTVERVESLDLLTVTLRFKWPMDPAATGATASYLLAAAPGMSDPAYAPGRPVAPGQVHYFEREHTASITMPKPLRAGGTYALSLGAIADTFGVKTSPGYRVQVRVTSSPLTLAGDLTADRHAISPLIYGVANMEADAARELGATLMRWGGNPATRYNWKLGNAWNAARDYLFSNGDYDNEAPADRQPSGVADTFARDNRANGLVSVITIPTIGWVARDTNPDSRSLDVPAKGGPPLRPNGDAINGYDPTRNRQRTSVPSRARKGKPLTDPPDLGDPSVAQDEWVYHLVRRFGRASDGGVRYYQMDNEPDLWPYTHTDVRPAQLSYEQMRDTFLDYATAVKDVDPTALVTGPVTWHPFTFWYSPLDAGNDNYVTRADFYAHGQQPFMDWWLDQIQRYDERRGRRSLDLLDVHFYPFGNLYAGDDSPENAGLRLRSTRLLWDRDYTEETWVQRKMYLIPRMRDLVNQNYPGTRIGVSEWGWGAEGTVNGAVAIADVLGIFGREGLDYAIHWDALEAGPGYNAFKLYTNYDGQRHSFSGTSFRMRSTREDLVSCYGALPGDGTALVMLVNKSADSDLSPSIQLAGAQAALGGASPRRARVWRLWPSDPRAIREAPAMDLSGSPPTLSLTLPSYSITLLRFEAGT